MNLRLIYLLCLLLSACGQTGALYLPQKQPPPPSASPTQKKDAQPKGSPAAPAPNAPQSSDR